MRSRGAWPERERGRPGASGRRALIVPVTHPRAFGLCVVRVCGVGTWFLLGGDGWWLERTPLGASLLLLMQVHRPWWSQTIPGSVVIAFAAEIMPW